MDVVVLTETKKKRAGSELLGNYVHLFSGVKKYERAKRGVSVLINKKWKGSINYRQTRREEREYGNNGG